MKTEFKAGTVTDLGVITLSEQEIIDFANAFDPLEFHTDKKAAEKSFFGRLIASGPHIFNLFHRSRWIPLYGKSVICGLEVNNWKFLKPVYAGVPVHGKAEILSAEENSGKHTCTVNWRYSFTDPDGTLLQVLDVLVLHRIS